MGAPKSWRSSRVRKTRGYAFGGPNPPAPTTSSDIAQLVEQFIRNEPVARSSRAVGANMVSVAQLVEPRFVEPAVASSSLVGYPNKYAVLAQLVVRHLAMVEVTGSEPVYRSNYCRFAKR